MDRDAREALINDYYNSGGAAAVTLGRVIVGAYYRDDRVLLSLGVEARAPFPKGYALEQGDWSLLDAVRNTPPLLARRSQGVGEVAATSASTC